MKIFGLILIFTILVAITAIINRVEVNGMRIANGTLAKIAAQPSVTSSVEISAVNGSIPTENDKLELEDEMERKTAVSTTVPTPTLSPTRTLFQFTDEEPVWYTVNDNVMGGISTSTVNVDTTTQQLTFKGNVSLENNGGFASIRSQVAPYNLGMFEGITLRVRGDGNDYHLRIRTEPTGPEIAYTAVFTTKPNTWQEVTISFADMIPLYRGFVVRDAGPLDPTAIRSFGFMITDKQEGGFLLEVDQITAVTINQ